MNPEQQTENQEKPVAERPPGAERPPASGPNDNRRHGRGRGRSRFKRDNRGDRGGEQRGGDRPPRRDQPGTGDGQRNKPGGTIGAAIEQVEEIRGELQKVLEDIQEVLLTLEQIEREKGASEEEIDMLRESLRLLQRDSGHGRHNMRSSNPPPPSRPVASASTPAESSESDPEDETE